MMTKELALDNALTQTILILDDLKKQAEGWRRRNLIVESQIEELKQITAKLNAMMELYEHILQRMPDSAHFERQLANLIEAAMKPERKVDNGESDIEAAFK